MEFRVKRSSNSNIHTLQHAGKRGMKWGFNDGKKNGRRTAGNESLLVGLNNGVENNKSNAEEMDRYIRDVIDSVPKNPNMIGNRITSVVDDVNTRKRLDKAKNEFDISKGAYQLLSDVKNPKLKNRLAPAMKNIHKDYKQKEKKYTELKKRYANTTLGRMEKQASTGRKVLSNILNRFK